MRRQRLLAPAQVKLISKLKEKSALLILWIFVIDQKEDVGEEVLKKDVPIQYPKQEAECPACLSNGRLCLQGPSWSRRERVPERLWGSAELGDESVSRAFRGRLTQKRGQACAAVAHSKSQKVSNCRRSARFQERGYCDQRRCKPRF